MRHRQKGGKILFQKKSEKDKASEANESLTVGLYREGALFGMVDEYLELCHSVTTNETDARSRIKPKARFPNIAGFCRFLGTGISDILIFKSEYPLEYDRLLAIFEDEALNSEVSPTLLSAYMKRRMQYALEDAPRSAPGEVRYCFEHDIFVDGG